MAKKNVPAGAQSAREKAQQMRESQARADRRTRNIIIGVVSVLVIAIVVVIVAVIVNRPTEESRAASIPEQFQAGEPIAVSSDGVGVTNPAVEDLTMYFDYTCPGCVTLESAIGMDLTAAAESGEFNLLYQPVITAGGAYNTSATSAALAVAADAPELFVPLQDALIAYYMDVLETGDTGGVGDTDTALNTVSDIARQVGVPEEIVSTFNNDAGAAYLTLSTNEWVQRDVEGRDRPASPELVYKDTKLNVSGNEPSQLMFSIQAEITRLNG